MRRMLIVSLAAFALAGTPGDTRAAEGARPLDRDWPQEGIFGTFDRAALQRGFQVFKEVCAACHAAKYLRFRDLAGIGLDQQTIKAIASEYTVLDGPDDSGEMFERPAKPFDVFPSPFPNPQAARAANGGALPVDLSLIVKAREGGDDYIYSLLVGYSDPPEGEEGLEGAYYNRYFPGGWIAMPPPLSDDIIEYADGTPATVEQMAADVTQFLAWLAEPELEERKQLGLKFMLFVLVMTGIFYAYKRRVWSRLH